MKKYICFLLFIISISFAGSITQTFNFQETDLSFSTYQDYVIPHLANVGYNHEVGNPYLPMGVYYVLVPNDAEVTSITIENITSKEIAGEYNVMPTPQSQPLSLIKQAIVEANPIIYAQNTPYPSELVKYYSTTTKSGYRLAGFVLYPLSYIPTEKKLILHTTITVKINYEQGKVSPINLTTRQREVFEKEIRSIVLNPQDIRRFAPSLHHPDNECNYLIITTEPYVANFQPLAEWRSQMGWRTEIVTVNSLTATYPGRDVQEKIRNGIINYFQNRGLIFVILGGDTPLLPPRIARVVASSYTGNIPCDLYFSDLDGTWDANGNSIFGEVPGDQVDMNPDIYVGRASIDNETEANTFVNKILFYEKTPSTDYLKRILLPSVMLFSQYNYHGRVVNDSIALITPLTWTDRHLIDPPSTTPMRESLNSGFHFCHPAAHGSEVGYYTQSSQAIYLTSDAYAQTNSSRLYILNSIACNSGDFGYSSECLAEAMMNNPNGGAVATIQNSRYGWGSPPGLGPSEAIDVRFYDFLFNRDSFVIGVAHARSKALFTAQANADPVTRWCVYELNLFGDPAMPMWTDVPQQITAQFPQVVPLGPTNLSIQVSRILGGPVSRALVSVQKGSEVFARGYTDNNGFVNLLIQPMTPGRLYITITAHNCYPYQDSAMVQSNGAYVTYLRAFMNDSARGNGDGIPNPGEGINMQTWVKNWGTLTALNVIGHLRTNHTALQISDSIKSFGTILANDSAYTGINGFEFTIAPTCTNGQNLMMQLYCHDALDSSWISNVFVRVGTPVLTFHSKSIYDPPPANNNSRLDPGEIADLIVTLRNQGYGNGYNVMGYLRSYDSRLVVLDSVGQFGTIMFETTGMNATDRFTLQAASTITPGTQILCSLRVCADGNYEKTVGFTINVGEFRTIDPIPDGPRTPVRYWAYDDIDSLYSQRPVYNWVEIKNIGTRITYTHNDQVRKVPLPAGFTLRYYGQRYDTISVSVDGFIRLGADTTRDYTNSGIPDPDGPAPMIAVKWDDFRESATGGSGAIYYYHNQLNNTFIVEWDSVSYYNATTTRDKFQIIFYDSTYTTPTGDNIFILQYMTANLNNSCTVGIEDPTETIGIQYVFDGVYHPAAAGLVNNRAIKFTTIDAINSIVENHVEKIGQAQLFFT
ncbi:MAG: C25 family cysteine peptidase, partial [candidate division WOR-3 bacterium]